MPVRNTAAVERRLALSAVLLAVCGFGAPLSTAATALGTDDLQMMSARLRARVEVLTGPLPAGRAAGSPGGRVATDTVAAWFAASGLAPAFAGSWFQEFPLKGEGWSGDALAGLTGRNVAGIEPGDGALAGRWLVVAAHIDHLGPVDPSASDAAASAAGAWYAGANDNASGVALVHELARSLRGEPVAASPPPGRRSVLWINFDGEEVGLQGSAWYVEHPIAPLDSIDAMINLDTVGRLSDGRLIVSGLGTAAPLAAAVAAAASASGLDINPSSGGWSGSDHMVFNTREVPVLFLFGGPYPEYNRPADAAATLDYAAMSRVAAFAGNLVDLLRSQVGEFDWVMVVGGGLPAADPGAASAAATGNRQTWLGTMPDFTEGQTGYRLAAVFEGSPAAAAGLQKGDLLVQFGDYPVADLGTFTTALRAYAPGDLVEIGIVREGRELRFTVALGDRAQRR